MTNLRVVDANLPEPPYPADTHVRGWKFQIDHERLLQSDTWALASAEMRPWLLMIWHTAWQQRPAGSFTDVREIIAAKIGMDRRIFEAHADVLLRGFVRHADGRLYHPVIVSQVLEWQEHNAKERARVRRWRDSRNADVTRNKRVSTTPVPEPVPDKRDTHPTDESPKNLPVSGPADRTPYSKILELWREILPELPQPHDVRHWTDARKAQIRARWKNELPDIEAWRDVFTHIRGSPFLMGQVPPRNGSGRPFRCDLFWITKPENLLKLGEGRYHG